MGKITEEMIGPSGMAAPTVDIIDGMTHGLHGSHIRKRPPNGHSLKEKETVVMIKKKNFMKQKMREVAKGEVPVGIIGALTPGATKVDQQSMTRHGSEIAENFYQTSCRVGTCYKMHHLMHQRRT